MKRKSKGTRVSAGAIHRTGGRRGANKVEKLGVGCSVEGGATGSRAQPDHGVTWATGENAPVCRFSIPTPACLFPSKEPGA